MTEEDLERALEKVREGLRKEGGDIEVISHKGDSLYVRLTGACETCPMAGLTLKNWVEKTLLEELKELKSIKAV